MRKLWVCGGLVLGIAGLVGCSGTTNDAQDSAPPSASPSAVALAINGRVAVELSTDGKGPAIGKPCTVPPNSKVKAGAEVRVTDDAGKILGTDALTPGEARGYTLKSCDFTFSFKVSGAAEKYVLTVEGFPPMPYIREDIRRGLSFWEDEGTLIPQ